ncbi:MMPL family transporter [Leuconostoc rapi]|uniref:MMPL family transporter n=1 Tax=Leuconostoc rapi TaxID=1406906 RepID=UPI00195810EE|nr:MMPL family transporter [Leuconostoc rapi]MBM7435931.1 RND superfamily putative drug exporter/membrane protein YdfJ [Leuconostoc rapi]
MGKLLAKLGAWIDGHAKITIFGFIITVIISVVAALSMGINFDSAGMSIQGSQSEKANKLMEKEFPNTKQDGGQIQIVLHSNNGEALTTAENQKAMNDMFQDVKKNKHVKMVVVPQMLQSFSKNNMTATARVMYKQKGEAVSPKTIKELEKSIKITRAESIQTELTSHDVTISGMDNGEKAEIVGLAIAFVILAITFASLIVAGIPIVSAILGLIAGMMLVLISTNFLSVATFSMSLVGMMGLAVGIDYALFLISRYRQELQNKNKKEALMTAMSTAGTSVIFAGVTVIVALLGMTVLGIDMLSVMGITAAMSILTAILTSLTFVPAMLVVLGDRVTGKRPNRALYLLSSLRVKGGWGKVVTKHKFVLTVVTVAILAVAATPFAHINLGLPNDSVKSEKLTERRAYDLLTEGYGQGSQATLVVLAKTDSQQEIKKVTENINDLSNVVSVSRATPSKDKDYQMITIQPGTDSNAVKTKKLVQNIRHLHQKNDLPEIFVTGATAINIDMSDALMKALPKFAILIVLFAFILLTVVFRSLLIPVVAVAGFILSLGATLGTIVFIAQDGHFIDFFGIPAKGAILNFLPVLVIGIMFGLAMDYEVFLVSRIREEYMKSHNTKQAVIAGMKDSGPAVIAAALIMMVVFSGFIFASDAIVKSMGLVLTSGILFDAILVRLILVPATISLFGEASWYLPKWLDKILPNIKID